MSTREERIAAARAVLEAEGADLPFGADHPGGFPRRPPDYGSGSVIVDDMLARGDFAGARRHIDEASGGRPIFTRARRAIDTAEEQHRSNEASQIEKRRLASMSRAERAAARLAEHGEVASAYQSMVRARELAADAEKAFTAAAENLPDDDDAPLRSGSGSSPNTQGGA